MGTEEEIKEIIKITKIEMLETIHKIERNLEEMDLAQGDESYLDCYLKIVKTDLRELAAKFKYLQNILDWM